MTDDGLERRLQLIEAQLKTLQEDKKELRKELDNAIDLMGMLDQRTSHLDQEWEQSPEEEDPADDGEQTPRSESPTYDNAEDDDTEDEEYMHPNRTKVEGFIMSAWADDEIKQQRRDELLELLDRQDEPESDYSDHLDDRTEEELIEGFIRHAEDEGVLSRKGRRALSKYLASYLEED